MRLPVVAIAMAVLSAPAQALDRSITLINETDFAIVAFYGSTVAENGWDENMLQDGALAAGSSVEVEFADHKGYCMFDLRAVFEDGAEIVSEGVNVCDWNEFYYRP